jgi:molybdenum cofactor biosynthesis enzyme MoaA
MLKTQGKVPSLKIGLHILISKINYLGAINKITITLNGIELNKRKEQSRIKPNLCFPLSFQKSK